jgi:DNA-binding NtrC family response regulator
LAIFFLKKHAQKNGKKISRISDEVLEKLNRYPFQGNVRELENIIASAVLSETSHELNDASVHLQSADQVTPPGIQDHFPTLSELERQHIVEALRRTSGNRTHAAKLLGIGLRTLQRKIKSMALD